MARINHPGSASTETNTKTILPRRAVFVGLTATLIGAQAFAASPKPNIIVILSEDVGYGDLGCYGATKILTPNCDKLAAEGLRFTDAHSAAAVCTPTRYSLLTGQYS